MARLGYLIEQIRGVSYKPEDLCDSLNEDGIPLLRANNIQDGKLNFEDIIYIDKKKVKSNQHLKSGDILICTSSGSKELVGKAAFVENDLSMTFGAFCKVIRSKICYPKYIGHFFNSPYYRKRISASSAGANINNIRNAHIDELDIRLPSTDEQKQISTMLDKVSDLISLRKQQLAKLDALINARFIELFGGVEDEDTLFNLCTFIDYRGKTPEKTETGLPFITAKNVKMHHISFDTQEFISKETYDKVMTRGFPRIGDVVFTTEAPLGNVCRIPYIDTASSIDQRIITMQTERLEPAYLEYALSSDEFKRKISEKSSGSTVTGIRSKHLEQLTIPVPPMALQEKFAAFVNQIDNSKLIVQQSLDKLEVLKKALMQKYFG